MRFHKDFGLIVKGSRCQSSRRWKPHPTSYFLSIWPYWLVFHNNVGWVLVFYSGNWNWVILHLHVLLDQTMSESQMWTEHFVCLLFLKKFLYSFFLLLAKSDKIYTPKSKIHDHTDITLFVFQIQRYRVPFFKLKSICTA